MVTGVIDRLDALTTSVAVKAPCKVESIANLTLYGEQTVNSVAVVQGDRVLVMAQTDAIENGIYVVDEKAWSRAQDFEGNRDVTRGTLVVVAKDALVGPIYQVTSAAPILINIDEIDFILASTPIGSVDDGLSLGDYDVYKQKTGTPAVLEFRGLTPGVGIGMSEDGTDITVEALWQPDYLLASANETITGSELRKFANPFPSLPLTLLGKTVYEIDVYLVYSFPDDTAVGANVFLAAVSIEYDGGSANYTDDPLVAYMPGRQVYDDTSTGEPLGGDNSQIPLSTTGKTDLYEGTPFSHEAVQTYTLKGGLITLDAGDLEIYVGAQSSAAIPMRLWPGSFIRVKPVVTLGTTLRTLEGEDPATSAGFALSSGGPWIETEFRVGNDGGAGPYDGGLSFAPSSLIPANGGEIELATIKINVAMEDNGDVTFNVWGDKDGPTQQFQTGDVVNDVIDQTASIVSAAVTGTYSLDITSVIRELVSESNYIPGTTWIRIAFAQQSSPASEHWKSAAALIGADFELEVTVIDV